MEDRNRQEVAAWLGGFAEDEKTAELLGYSVGRLLLREGSHWRMKAEGLRLEIGHVADWLKTAIADGEGWLDRTDSLGRPLKLMKFGDFRQMTAEADKAMFKAIQRSGRAEVDPSHERIHMELDDNYAIVELTSEAALDKESLLMQHCIGNGGYDSDLIGDGFGLFSLRDPFGKPHATLRVDKIKRIVMEMQGKQNAAPAHRYMPYIRQYIQAGGLKFAHGGENRLGMVEDIFGEWHDLNALPDDLYTRGSLNMATVGECRMPRRLVVNGDFVAPPWMDRMPDILHVAGNFMSSSAPTFSPDFKAGMMSITCGASGSFQGSDLPQRIEVGTMLIRVEGRDRLPRNLEVTGNLVLEISSTESVPDRLKVRGQLDVSQSRLTKWKGDIDCGGLSVCPESRLFFSGAVRVRGDLEVSGGDVRFARELRVSGNANFSEAGAGRPIAELPSRLIVAKDLDLGKCEIGVMPRHLEVGGDLVLTDAKFPDISGLKRAGGTIRIEGTNVSRLPDGLVKVGGLMAAMSQIEVLPEGFTTKGNVILIGTPISELPAGLVVGGNLFCQNTDLETVPDDAVIKGRVHGVAGFRDVIDRTRPGGRPQVRSVRR